MSKKKNKKVASEEDSNNGVVENNQEENVGNNQNGEDGEKKDGSGGGGGKNAGGGGGGKNAVVLKIDLHCEGCTTKVIKRIRSFQGVTDVQVDGATNKLSVTGKVDPVKLKQTLEEKLHKKVEVLSPVLKKGKDDGKKDGGDGDGKAEKNKDSKECNKSKKSDGEKDKVIPVTTAVLKVTLHCEGCIQKIQKIITKTKGYQEMKLDRKKDLVTVTGAIEMKTLVVSLKKHLKRNVEILSPKKDEKKDNKENQKENGGGSGSGNGGGGKGKEKVCGEAVGGAGGEEVKTAGNKMQVQFGYSYPMMPYLHGAQYGPGTGPGPTHGAPYGQVTVPFYDPYPYNVHAPQIFSDENPNACSIM